MKKIIFMFLLSLSTVIWADDIEIYTGSKDDFKNKNNIMLILDTSGSMDSTLSNGETRFQQAKEGLTEVLSSLPDRVNVGLARYNYPGGSIAYPVRNLADLVPLKIEETAVRGINDAYEDSNGTVFNSTTTLPFGGNTTQAYSQISQSSDDAEECYDGSSFTTTGYYIDINYDVSSCYLDNNGLIFRNLNIPKGAIIKDAYVRMRLYSNSNGTADTRITVEDSLNPVTFSFVNKVNDRIELKDQNNNIIYRDWRVPADTYGNYITTPNLKKLIQPLVSNTNWNQYNNGISIFFKFPSSGNRGDRTSFFTYDNFRNYAPELFVDYIINQKRHKVGIRFEEVDVPSKVVITKATLNLNAARNNGSGTLDIYLDRNKNTEGFLENDNNISNRILEPYSKSVSFNDWEKDTIYNFDVLDLLEKKFNNGVWCGGEDLSFILESNDINSIYAVEQSSKTPASLNIEYTQAEASSCSIQNEIKQTTKSIDDARERLKNGNVYLGNGSIVVTPAILSAFIQRDLNIPKSTINNFEIIESYLEFTSTGNDKGNATIRIYGEKSPNPEPYSNNKRNLTNRTKTNNYIDWNLSEDSEYGLKYRTPDISSIIYEIVSDSNWENGNKISFFLEGLDGTRRFGAVDPNPSQAPKLVIRYKGDGSFEGLTVRQQLINSVQSSKTSGYTPIEGSIYEVAQYFLGKEVDYGKTRNPSYYDYQYRRISEDDTYTNGTRYLPPNCSLNDLNSPFCRNEKITGTPIYNKVLLGETCETNSIILVTDGYSYPYYSGSNYYKNLKNDDNESLASSINSFTNKTCYDNYSCGENLTEYLYNTDFSDAVGKQNIYTYVIGFDELDSSGYLNNLARKGGGYFLTATGTEGLVNALSKIISTILDIDTTLAAPGVSVNQNNRFEHLKEVYYSVFKPSTRKSWNGNLKKYKIDDLTPELQDQFGNTAVDETTGFFKKGTTSFWSDSEDGHDVTLGGAAAELKSPYNIFTYTGANEPNEENLNSNENIFSELNSSLNKDLFNLSDFSINDSDFSEFLKWGRGIDVNDEDFDGDKTEYKLKWGDPLHSRPILINYNENDNYVFVSTNRGYLHAINSLDGSNAFSFIPQEMLPNLYQHYLDEPGKHLYGLDSSWVAWRNDFNKDGKIVAADGDHIYLYGGMRRGGRNYYALDVTDINNPKLKFVIHPNKSPEFANIGQTWSEPLLAQVKIDGIPKVVLIFAGGYDTSYDDPSYDGLVDSQGNQIYMVDAENGELIWWASNIGSGADLEISGLNHSIVSKVESLDLNNDRFVDYLYFGDLSGQVFKINIDNISNNGDVSKLASGKIITKIGRTATINSNEYRKIYETIQAVPVRNQYEQYIALVLGTGYRAHPLNKDFEDIVLVIKDKENYYIGQKEDINTPYLLSDFENVSNNVSETNLASVIPNKKGYYIDLKEADGSYVGEKMLSEPIVYNNNIILSTYIPNTKASLCSPVQGASRTYQMNVFNLLPIDENREDPNNPDTTERYIDEYIPGITTGTKIIYTENSVLGLTNTKLEKLTKSGGLGVKKVFWYNKETD